MDHFCQLLRACPSLAVAQENWIASLSSIHLRYSCDQSPQAFPRRGRGAILVGDLQLWRSRSQSQNLLVIHPCLSVISNLHMKRLPVSFTNGDRRLYHFSVSLFVCRSHTFSEIRYQLKAIFIFSFRSSKDTEVQAIDIYYVKLGVRHRLCSISD